MPEQIQKYLEYAWNFTRTDPLSALLFVVLFYLGQKLLRKIVKYFFAIKRSRHLIFLKITLPRGDTKIDKEKETKKDFKEKVAIMEQLYRALYEIKELDLWHSIVNFVWRYQKISFELVLKESELFFYIVTLPYYVGIVEKQVTAFYPDADIETTKPYEFWEKGYHLKSYYLYFKRPFWYPLRTYKTMEDDPLNDLSNVLSKFKKEDRAVIQLIIRPTWKKNWQKKANKKGTLMFKGKKDYWFANLPILNIFGKMLQWLLYGSDKMGQSGAPGASSGDPYIRMLQTDEEIAKQIGEKAGQNGFDAGIKIMGASLAGKREATEIVNNLMVAFNVFTDAAMNYFQARRIVPVDFFNNLLMYFNFTYRFFQLFMHYCILVPEELATLYHLPDSVYNHTPIISWLPYKVLPAPMNMPKEGLMLGYNVHRGVKKEVYMLQKDRFRHHYIIGQTGTGKSNFISFLARQDVWNGEGVCVVDPHGDLIEDILKYVPKERAKEVIYFDPADCERPMGLNMLEANTPEEMDRASLDATEIFIKLFGDEIFGPRIQHYFRNACLTLMEDKEEGATLIDVPRMFVDDEFMRYKVVKIKNPVVKSFWEHEYAKTGAREKEEMIPYFSAKFGPFITNTTIRNIIGQPKSVFNFREVMDSGKVLLINLSKGRIGALNAQLLGLVIVNKISMAALSRSDIPEKERKPFFLYVDEFQNFATETFATILSEARKYNLGLIMAHQYINQLVTKEHFGEGQSAKIRDAVFGNVGTLMSFKVGAEDAEYLAKEYAPVLSEQDIIGIGNYKAYLKLSINNSPSRPFSLETVYDTTGQNEKIADIIKRYCRIKYGRKKEFVDQEIEARLGIS
ncbi:hypothetical protein COT40_01280 [Candidatus Peregrinibacteria bacterium CG08_land_8_20_14_0_20_41_10]|nr:MAG: hypothetical protein COT40_01280 [Candidatus Peregrinibacteria bacterium CG08_land_8_20_14_0_20_41_10]